jgi:hypothetical protein
MWDVQHRLQIDEAHLREIHISVMRQVCEPAKLWHGASEAQSQLLLALIRMMPKLCLEDFLSTWQLLLLSRVDHLLVLFGPYDRAMHHQLQIFHQIRESLQEVRMPIEAQLLVDLSTP